MAKIEFEQQNTVNGGVVKVDLAELSIGDKVQRHVMAQFYRLQLTALQKEAAHLGYFFAQGGQAAILTPKLLDNLAYAVAYRRKAFLSPLMTPEQWEKDTDFSIKDGYAQQYVQSLLAGLSAIGLNLQEGPDSFVRLGLDEDDAARQRAAAAADEIRAASFMGGYFAPAGGEVDPSRLGDLDLPVRDSAELKALTELPSDLCGIDGRPNDDAQSEKVQGAITGLRSGVSPRVRRRRQALAWGGMFVIAVAGIGATWYGASALKSPVPSSPAVSALWPAGEQERVSLAPSHLQLPTVITASPEVPSLECVGAEIVCSSMTTSDPAKTLHQVAATIPANQAKQYEVRVVVIPK
jgi:hypothetical protein